MAGKSSTTRKKNLKRLLHSKDSTFSGQTKLLGRHVFPLSYVLFLERGVNQRRDGGRTSPSVVKAAPARLSTLEACTAHSRDRDYDSSSSASLAHSFLFSNLFLFSSSLSFCFLFTCAIAVVLRTERRALSELGKYPPSSDRGLLLD